MSEPDLEQHLRAARLAAPSDQLDRRMDAIFQRSAAADPAERPGSSWWLVGLSAAGAAALLLCALKYSWSPPSAPVAPVVHRVVPAGLMRDLLLTPPAQASAPPVLELSVRL